MKVQIISGSVRDGRESHKVALFLQNWLKENSDAKAEIIDLKERDFPMFRERLSKMKEKDEKAVTFSKEISEADAVILVCPEYNGGYSSALKNVIDVLYDEWQKKPLAMALVTSGDMSGAQVAEQLQFIMYKIGAYVAKSRFHVGNVSKNFNDDGTSNNSELYNKNAAAMWKNLQELMGLKE